MLKGIPEIIGSDLLKALADMGHGDILVVADHFYPPYSKSPNAVSVQAKGNTAPEMIDAILKLMPLDVEYCDTPLEYMVPDADSGVDLKQCDTWDEAIAAAKEDGSIDKFVAEANEQASGETYEGLLDSDGNVQ